MKKFKKWALVAIGMMTLAVSLGSCSDDDNDYYLRTVPNALVTVKVTGDRCIFNWMIRQHWLLAISVRNLLGIKRFVHWSTIR